VLTLSLRGKAAGSDEQKRWATEETTSEEVRMLYVAITRAKNRCTIHVPEHQEISKSSLALLFKEDERGDLPKALTRLAQQARDCISFVEGKEGRVHRSGRRGICADSFTSAVHRSH
jgi:ATP-dependent exoDNAse (exonuclease V) beta subunit (contains helicase and exonuclease domains)